MRSILEPQNPQNHSSCGWLFFQNSSMVLWRLGFMTATERTSIDPWMTWWCWTGWRNASCVGKPLKEPLCHVFFSFMHMDAAMMFFWKKQLDDDSNIILFVANRLFSWDDEGTLRVGSPSEWPKWFINGGYYPLTRWDDPPSTRTQTLARDFHDYRWVYAFEIFASLVKNDEIREDQCDFLSMFFFWCLLCTILVKHDFSLGIEWNQ